MEQPKLVHHFYVAVLTVDKKFYLITSVEGNQCHWQKGALPLEMTHEKATKVADGLFKNGYNAVVIQSVATIMRSKDRNDYS